jgi:hypothetical protein
MICEMFARIIFHNYINAKYPGTAVEATALQMRNVSTRVSYAGQLPPQNIFNPRAESYKRHGK